MSLPSKAGKEAKPKDKAGAAEPRKAASRETAGETAEGKADGEAEPEVAGR